jgi:hypothetical protein
MVATRRTPERRADTRESLGESAAHGRISAVGPTAVEHHQGQHLGPAGEGVQEVVLVEPDDLAHDAPEAVAPGLRADSTTHGKPDLERRVDTHLGLVGPAITDNHRSDTYGLDVRPPALEEGADESLALEPARAGKAIATRLHQLDLRPGQAVTCWRASR